MGAAVGIDLGTTNTVVSVVRDGFPVTLTDSDKRRLLPSVVSFHPSGKVLVGDPAKERRIVDPTSTVFSVKRLIGRSWESPEVQRARKSLPFELVEGEGHEIQIQARGERYTLPEISAFILRRAKAIAEVALAEPVRQAVITVPANFNDPQREATKLAGKLAGLEVLRILNEPTAAALAYGETAAASERVAVYDLGGGTFDVTLLDVRGAVFQVIATGGDTSLGGDDIDELVAGLMTDSLLRQFRFDARNDPTARATLKARAEELKIVLSSNATADTSLNNLVRGEGGKFLPASFKLERRVLETLAAPILERTLETCRSTLNKVGMSVSDVERVLLVGGSTRMPLVGRQVEQYFGRTVSARVNPDEVVAHGAAIQAAALARGAEVPKPSFRPRPSFSFAVGAGLIDAPPKESEAPATPRMEEVVVPLPPQLPGNLTAAAPLHPAARAATKVGVGPVAPARASLSDDQEELLKAFLGVDAAPAPAAAAATKSQAEIEVELRAFLMGEEPASPPSEGLVAVVDQPEAPISSIPPLVFPDLNAPVSTPFLEFDLPPVSVPTSPAVAKLSAHPSPVISEFPIPDLPPVPDLPPLVARAPSSAPPKKVPDLTVPVPVAQRPPAPPAPPPLPKRPPPPKPARKGAPLLVDVTPLSLGIETVGGFCDVIIRGNSPIPCDRTRSFRTASDGQTSVVVKICQGESDRFENNTTLGDLRLSGFRPAPRGEVEITVTFEIDADGILNVQAGEGTTGRSAVARIELHGGRMDAKKVQAMMDRQAQREVV